MKEHKRTREMYSVAGQILMRGLQSVLLKMKIPRNIQEVVRVAPDASQ